MKICCAPWLLCFFLVFALVFSSGCSRSGQKMEAPKIRMITKDNLHGVICPDAGTIFLTEDYGAIYKSADSGASWAPQESGIKGEKILVDGTFVDAANGWFVGLHGTVLHTGNGGAVWEKQQTNTDKHLFGVSFVDKNNGWAVGNWNTIIHTADGGTTWARQTPEEDRIYKNVFFVDTARGWVVGEKGYISRTTDGGRTWLRQMPKKWEAMADDDFENPKPALYSICFTDASHGWISGIEGTLLKTQDSGDTWEILQTGTSLSLYTVFVKYGRGWIVGDKGAYLMSEDGGSTWKLYDDAIKTRAALRDIFFSSPDSGWAVGMGGTVVHTADGGRTWEFFSGLSYAMKFFEMPRALEFRGMVT
ncbi:MAG: YCF48-related protein, partial [Pseudomonadota bacterium]